MNKKTLFKIIVAVIIGIAGIGIVLAIVMSPYLFKPISTTVKSPSEALQEFIKLTVKEDFLPSEYNVVKDESDLVRFGFGRRYAINHSMSWRKNDSSFLAFVGYDKEHSDQLIGYTVTIYVKGVEPKGSDMARIYLKEIPEKGWIRSNPKSLSRFTSEVSNVIWNEEKDKLFLSVLSLVYNEPEAGFFPDENVKEVTVISFDVYKPNNWLYDRVKEFQKSEHELYGQ